MYTFSVVHIEAVLTIKALSRRNMPYKGPQFSSPLIGVDGWPLAVANQLDEYHLTVGL